MKSKFLFLFTLAFHFSFSQGPITVQLTRKIEPIMKFGKLRVNHSNDTVHLYIGNGKDSLVHIQAGYNLVGGDFEDGKVKFAIVVNLPKNPDGEYMLALAPYRADSVQTVDFMSSSLKRGWNIKSGTLIVIKAFGREYSASINKDGTEITLAQLFGNYEKPDVQLYDSLMPDCKFLLFNGGTSTFAEYKHQNKYIYVIFWNSWQPGDTKQINELKRVSNGYRDVLTILSFHSSRADTSVIKKMERDNNIDWIEAKDGFDGQEGFPGTGIMGGVLFDGNGKALAVDIRPDELNTIMEKLLHIRE